MNTRSARESYFINHDEGACKLIQSLPTFISKDNWCRASLITQYGLFL